MVATPKGDVVFDKYAEYSEHIHPLVMRIQALCMVHEIPFAFGSITGLVRGEDSLHMRRSVAAYCSSETMPIEVAVAIHDICEVAADKKLDDQVVEVDGAITA